MLGRERLLGAEVFLHTGVTDMRCGMDRLSSKVSEEFNRSVMTGGLYVFLSRCHRKVKILYWDSDGYALWMKRLEAGVFRVEKRAGELVEVESHTRIVRRGRKPLPDNLPRHRIEHPPETTLCPCCSEKLTLFDGEITEELEFTPAQFYVNQHVRMKGVCPKGCSGVERAELPATVQPLFRRRPGPGLLAHVLILKFVDHCPLYRQEQGYLRCGIELRRQRLSDWVSAVAQEIFLPLWRALKAEVLSSSYAQGDETEIKVQDGEVEGKCHKGYLWAALAPEKDLAFFEYHESRAGSSTKEVFEGFEGTLQTDLYAGYNAVILPEKVDRIACLAHVRRKFIEVESIAKPQVTSVLQMIGKLYALERKWSNAPPEKLQELRQKFSKPELEQLRKYLEALSVKTLPQSPLMKAVAQNAAIIYSLVATCKLQKVNVYDWMKDVIARVPAYPLSRIGELLPHRWKLAKKQPETRQGGRRGADRTVTGCRSRAARTIP